jgi:hypothetical protein
VELVKSRLSIVQGYGWGVEELGWIACTSKAERDTSKTSSLVVIQSGNFLRVLPMGAIMRIMSPRKLPKWHAPLTMVRSISDILKSNLDLSLNLLRA